MTAHLSPADATQARDAVAHAAAHRRSLEILGGGSKRRLGRPPVCDDVLDISALSGIIDYDPAELVVTAQAAAPLARIKAMLAEHEQMLAFEPPDWRGLLGGGGGPTLGGVVACNLAGPRRVRAGAPRDHVLGFAGINGRGQAWRSGGRVVKNVTGYDMCKLQAGAYGTLSVLTELSLRVVPCPEVSATVVLHGLADAQAVAALSRALNAPHEVSAAAHLPAPQAALLGVKGLDGAATLLRLEGPSPSVAFRAAAVQALFDGATRLDAADSAHVWTRIAAVSPLLPSKGRIIWRVLPTPSAAAAFAAGLRAHLAAELFYDWGGGLIWLSLDGGEAGQDGGEAHVRGVLSRFGGHAMLVAAPDEMRASVPVFQPEEGALAALSDRVKTSFDPLRILNPGRMHKAG